MSVLSVARAVALVVGIERPLAVFSSTDRQWLEMQGVADEAARTIAQAHDWQALRRVHTVTGNGRDEAFPLPPDYDRMPDGANLWSTRARGAMTHIVQPDDWLAFHLHPMDAIQGVWSIFGGRINIRPVLAPGEIARFSYQSGAITSSGRSFSNDADSFALDERLLKLAMIALWRQNKGQDFTAELADYEIALTLAKGRDGGSRPVLSGNHAGRGRASNVWPGRVTG